MARGERRGRAGRRAGRDGAVQQQPWTRVENPLPPIEVLSTDQVEAIHEASLTIIEQMGLEFLNDEARALLKTAGAEVEPDGVGVRIPRELVLASVAQAPASFTLHARNPERNLEVGGRTINFGIVSSPPFASDMDGGRRPGNFHDFENLVRLAQALNVIHFVGGYPVEPTDLPAESRHLDCLARIIRLSDKVFHAYSLGRARIRDGLELARIARGVSAAQFAREPSLLTVVNTNSPLRIDGPMLDGIITMARHNQASIITPFTLSGAMAPATIAGALAQQNAEALAGITVAQIANPGAPVIYGSFTSNVDMKSGAPAFGTPEYVKATLAGGQLARRYGLPYRSSNANAANTVDAQAGYESTMSLWAAVMSHTNVVKHAAGWLEGGLVASFEKVVLDAELLQMMTAFLEPIVVDQETLGLDAIREVGPGGHFFGAAHTLARYETAFYPPMVSDWRNFETWQEAGAPTAYDHAHRLMRQLLDEFEPPPLDPAIDEEVSAFVAKRKEAGDLVPVT